MNSTEEQRMIEKPVNRGDKKKIGWANRLEKYRKCFDKEKVKQFMIKVKIESRQQSWVDLRMGWGAKLAKRPKAWACLLRPSPN